MTLCCCYKNKENIVHSTNANFAQLLSRKTLLLLLTLQLNLKEATWCAGTENKIHKIDEENNNDNNNNNNDFLVNKSSEKSNDKKKTKKKKTWLAK